MKKIEDHQFKKENKVYLVLKMSNQNTSNQCVNKCKIQKKIIIKFHILKVVKVVIVMISKK